MIKVTLKVETDPMRGDNSVIELHEQVATGNSAFIAAKAYELVLALTQHMIPMLEARYGKQPTK